MTDLVVHGAAGPLRGIIPAPPHRDVAEMALLAGALGAVGQRCDVRGKGLGSLHFAHVLRQLGVEVEKTSDGLTVTGVGLEGFRAPTDALDVASAANCLALTIGLVAALPFAATVHCSEALARAALQPIARVLRFRGAELEGQFVVDDPGVLLPPLEIAATPRLSALEQHAILPHAGLEKVAALASGLLAGGRTTLLEPLICNDTLPRLLRHVAAPIESAGALTRLDPLAEPLTVTTIDVPGDPDTSLLLLAAALAAPESVIGLRNVVSQPSDAGALGWLRENGAGIDAQARATLAGQATADVTATCVPSGGIQVVGERAFTAGASLPSLAAWAAHARADSAFTEPVRDPDHPERGRHVALILAAFGVPAHFHAASGTLSVTGGAWRSDDGARRRIACHGDGMCAMLAAVLGLAAGGTTTIADADCIVARFPRFVGSLRALGAHLETS